MNPKNPLSLSLYLSLSITLSLSLSRACQSSTHFCPLRTKFIKVALWIFRVFNRTTSLKRISTAMNYVNIETLSYYILYFNNSSWCHEYSCKFSWISLDILLYSFVLSVFFFYCSPSSEQGIKDKRKTLKIWNSYDAHARAKIKNEHNHWLQ